MPSVAKRVTRKSPSKSLPVSNLTDVVGVDAATGQSFILDPNKPIEVVNKADIKPVEQDTIKIVTSMGLKRTHQSGPLKHAKIIFKDTVYHEVMIAGIRKRVVWDEIIRALVDRELASLDPFAGLENFLPE